MSEQLVPIEDQTSQDIFLLVDEVPCNSDPGFGNIFWGSSSGDWKGLKTNGVNLIMALKPIDNSSILSRKKTIDLHFPEDIAHLQLSRVYRCTKNIAEFYQKIVTHITKV